MSSPASSPQRTAAATAVPALVRGLSVLRLLAKEGPLRLDAVQAQLNLPRSSAFRLLEALAAEGYAIRNSEHRYQALWQLSPAAPEEDAFRSKLHAMARSLRDAANATIEWYQPNQYGMALKEQWTPSDAPVRVAARPGFLRAWDQELDAVASVAHACYPHAPETTQGLSSHSNHGEPCHLTLKETRKRIAAAQAGHALDPFYNRHSVRRAAVAIGRGPEFKGILALADFYRFGEDDPFSRHLPALGRSAQSLAS